GADFDVERLLQHAPARGPELGKLQNQILKGHRLRGSQGGSSPRGKVAGRGLVEAGPARRQLLRISINTRADLSSFSRWRVMRSRCACSSSRSAEGTLETLPIASGLDVRAASRNASAGAESRRLVS